MLIAMSFELSFPPVRGVHLSLTLKTAVVHACDNQDGALVDSLVDCEIARETDAGPARLARYMSSGTDSHLNDAVEHFQLVLDQRPVGHPDRAAALTNLAWVRLQAYIQKDHQDIDREDTAVCIQHPMKASTFNKTCSNSVLRVINTVPAPSTILDMPFGYALTRMAALMI
ncbi:hypothetical protein DEU56DRAFT_919249 [Suillus clintonianus]|uniref:uncharacterized protein n=1 Tax=Suillus clintonianus TaxID=1904413 RepID=UPI001B870F32|nr:uncharacterized protein DEU56DRAFT_919249 [Suillus clintonianus]KAG2116270.1 hypothetical protein DEU56DRAFT_919249 [Suillus clintonianus]